MRPHLGLAALVADDHADRAGEAPLPGRPEGRAHDRGDAAGEVGVVGDDHRVLGATERLHPLAGRRRAGGDQAGCLGLADEGDRVHPGVVEDRLDRLAAAVHQADDARRKDRGLVDQLADPLTRPRVPLRRLQHEGVSAGDRVGQEPERDHRREVERGDRRDHTDGLADQLDIDAGGDPLERFALEQVRDGSRGLDRLDAAADLAIGVGECLAHVGRDQRGELLTVLDQRVPQGEHGAGTLLGGHLTPGGLRGAGRHHRGIHVGRSGQWHSGAELAGRRVPVVERIARLGLLPPAPDVVLQRPCFGRGGHRLRLAPARPVAPKLARLRLLRENLLDRAPAEHGLRLG